MRSLVLFRHARAAPVAGREDHARALDAAGRRAAAAMGRRLAALAIRPDRVLCSSALRAIESWEEAREAWAEPPPVTEARALYLADADDLLETIWEVETAIETLMVVGHNPGLHHFALALIAEGEAEALARLGRGFPAGAVAVFDFATEDWRGIDGGEGRLRSFLAPED